MKSRRLLLLAMICAAAAIGNADAATRLALVGGEGNGGIENVLDIATALLGKDADLQLLDRAEVGRVLREHELSLAGLVDAVHAVKTGQLLQADLFAVLEGSLTNETAGATSLGLVVFDAKTGSRYADSALLASNTASAAAATAEAVRAAAAKYHRKPEDLHTLGLLTVRNADLPRQFDGLCDTVGLLLERELTASPGIAVLERRRLEQVTRERSVAPDAQENRLLSSLRMIELDIGQDGAGLRGALALVGADGARTKAVSASVPARDAAALAHLLADKTERFLNAPSDRLPPNRAAEAARFHREYLLLLQHRDYVAAVHPLDAAIALAPEQTSWQPEMALLLPLAAIELIDPGGQNWQRSLPAQPSLGDRASGLALGQRCADLLLDLSREAVSSARPGEPLPEVLKANYRSGFCNLLQRMADVRPGDFSSAGDIAALAGKERTLRMEVIEPFLRNQSVDKASFAAYSSALYHLFDSGLEVTSLPSEQRTQDDVLALSHWVELSHKLNPPDGSGAYAPVEIIVNLGFFVGHRGSQVEALRQTLEQDQDPVIRLYARAARLFVRTNVPAGERLAGPTAFRGLKPVVTNTLESERDFRLYAQDLLTHGEAAKPGPLREHVWRAIMSDLWALLNGDGYATEHLEACRFAFAQGDIQLVLFQNARRAFEIPRYHELTGELELVNGMLKLILEKPEAYPTNNTGQYYARGAVIKDLQQTRDRLAGELAERGGRTALATNAPPFSPWKQKVCLLDMATPINGYAWMYKPVVKDGQVFALALGFHEWGLPEDSLQLVRVPLEGGAPSFLGHAPITVTEWVNRPYVLRRGPQSRLKDETPTTFDVGRAACAGAGCYFAATCSGMYIFPTNGGQVLHLGATNGLPSDDTHTLAFLDGKLYIGAGEIRRDGYLASYDPDSGKVAILASSRRSERVSPFDDQPPFYILSLVSDQIRHRLLMAVSTVITPNGRIPDITPSMGIWSYQPSSSEYKRLAPLLIPTPQATFVQISTWAGLAGANALAVKETYIMSLFDLPDIHLLSAGGAWAQKTLVANASNVAALLPGDRLQPPRTNAGAAIWDRPVPGYPGNSTIVDGPYFVRDGWFYSARPFERMALADGKREELPPLRTDYPIKLDESLQLLDDGKHVLAADQFSIWLLELSPEAAQARVANDKSNPAFGKP